MAYRVLVPVVGLVLRFLQHGRRKDDVRGGEHFDRLLAGGEAFVVVAWHGQGLLCILDLVRRVSEPGRLTFLVSPSVDGDPATQLLERWGAQVVRGSATRSGVGSLRKLYRTMSAGGIPVIFADGPTGPVHEYKVGALLLSQLARAPILPMAYAIDRGWRLRAWDRHLLPGLFSRGVVAFGEPYLAPAQFAEGELEEIGRREGERLEVLGEAARARLEGAPVSRG